MKERNVEEETLVRTLATRVLPYERAKHMTTDELIRVLGNVDMQSVYPDSVIAEMVKEAARRITEATGEDGIWIVYGYDVGAYPIMVCANEIDAMRKVEENGYGHAKFWKFGKEWSNS